MNNQTHRQVIFLFTSIICIASILSTKSVFAIDAYVSRHYVKEAEVTVQFSEKVWAITQESLSTDEFFQLAGSDYYDSVMQQIRDKSVFLDAVSQQLTWEFQLAVYQDSEYEFREYTETEILAYADEVTGQFTSVGVNVSETYIIHNTYVPFIILNCDVQGEITVLGITCTDGRMLMVTINKLFADITDGQLKDVSNSIFTGMLFDKQNTDTVDKQINSDYRNINIPEFGASFVIPTSNKIATRTEGDYEYIAETLHKKAEAIPSYMEKNNYYFMAVDSCSNLRFNLGIISATADTKNSVYQTDDELLSLDFDDSDIDLLSSGGALIDKWVERNDSYAFLCLYIKMGITDQYMILAITSNDGYIYTFMFRDYDTAQLKRISSNVLKSFIISNSQSENVTLTLQTNSISLGIPEKWTILSQDVSEDVDVPTENILLEGYHIDGTKRVVVITIIDTAMYIWDNPNTIQRDNFDLIYGKSLLSSYLDGQNISVTNALKCGSTEYTAFYVNNEKQSGGMVCVARGYLIQIVWTMLDGDVFSDSWLPVLQQFAGDLSTTIKEK